jgi:prepilin-type N-terminal cleavage/methylation domain-containing protein
MMDASSRRATSAGFTLVELLIAMLVGGILISATVAALFWGLATTGHASGHIEDAARVQLASGWFVTDVHGAEGPVDEGPRCDERALDGEPVGAVPLASFASGLWGDDPTAAVYADWWLTRAPGTDRIDIERVSCTPAGDQQRQTMLTGVGEALTEISCDETSCTASWPPERPLTVMRRVSP